MMTFEPGIISMSFDDKDEGFTIVLKHNIKLKKLSRHEVHAVTVLIVCECNNDEIGPSLSEIVTGIKKLKIDQKHPTTT